MQQCDRLKQLLRDFYFNAVFIVIAASRPVNKNVSTGSEQSKRRYRAGRSYTGRPTNMANYQTGGYQFWPMSGWNGRIGSIDCP